MAKIAALAAYFYQAALAFGLLIVLSHVLPAAEFAAYSLFVSIVQFVGIACFEWLRFACNRFYPGPDDQSERAEREAIVAEFLVGAIFCPLGALAALAWGISVPIALIGAVATVLQSAGELHLTVLRFRQAFRLFSWLQGLRATIFTAATLGSAAISADFEHVVLGVLIANLIYSVIAWLATRRLLPLVPRWNGATARRHLAYGGVSAGASVATLFAPLGLKAILTAALGPAGAAAPMLALDLLQRLFVLIVSSLQAIRYPELVALFDSADEDPAMRQELGRYYALLVAFALLTAAGVLALLVPAAEIAVPEALRLSFLRTAPLLAVMALLRALTQILLPTPAHLRRHLPAIAWLAAGDCAATCAGALLAMWLYPGSDVAVAAGGAAGAAGAILGGSLLLRLVAFEMPWRPVVLSAAAAVASFACVRWFAGDPLLASGSALTVTLLLGGPACLGLLRWIVR
ncbi:hypothetical protein [Bosea thiooxidans]